MEARQPALFLVAIAGGGPTTTAAAPPPPPSGSGLRTGRQVVWLRENAVCNGVIETCQRRLPRSQTDAAQPQHRNHRQMQLITSIVSLRWARCRLGTRLEFQSNNYEAFTVQMCTLDLPAFHRRRINSVKRAKPFFWGLMGELRGECVPATLPQVRWKLYLLGFERNVSLLCFQFIICSLSLQICVCFGVSLCGVPPIPAHAVKYVKGRWNGPIRSASGRDICFIQSVFHTCRLSRGTQEKKQARIN